MKILVLGIGRQGSVVLWDLMESDDVTEIVAGDINFERASQWVAKLKQIDSRAEKIEPMRIDVSNIGQIRNILNRGFDVVCDCLLWHYTIPVAKACIDSGVNHVDLYSTDEIYELDKSAKDAGVTVIPSCGLDPGLDHVLEGYAARKLDKVEKLLLYCGAIPQKGTPAYNTPLRYRLTWTFAGVIDDLMAPATILKDGKEVEIVDKLSDPEIVIFPEPVGETEAWWVSSYPKKLIQSLGLKDVRESWCKTVRWRGWCEAWRQLIDLHLVSEEPIKIKGTEISPREFLNELGEKYLRYNFEAGDRDLVIEKIDVIGQKDGADVQYSYLLIDFYDEKKGLTAVQRTTCFTNSIVCQMIGRGEIKEKGVVNAGLIGWNTENAKKFFSELKKKNIVFAESVTKPLD